MKSLHKRNNSKDRILIVGVFFLLSTFCLHSASLTVTNQGGFSGTLYDDAPTISSKTTPNPLPTLVHFDPYFLGGFRNQHMRFVAFVSHAVSLNISQILLPSLRWGDHYNKSKSIQHELLFDVDHWNSKAESLGIPLLVHYDPDVLEGTAVTNTPVAVKPPVVPCFNLTSGLYSGLDESILRNPLVNLRKINTWSMLGQGKLFSHCRRTWGEDGENDPAKIKEAARQGNSTGVIRFTHLIPHGGLSGGAGRLWHEYTGLQARRWQMKSEKTVLNGELVNVYPEHVSVERILFQLLRPTQRLQVATDSAIKMSVQNLTRYPRLLALHPRVEQEMMFHRCSRLMETNLTKVFELLQHFSAFRDRNQSWNYHDYRFDLVFIAGSKQEIEKTSDLNNKLGMIMNENRNAFRHARLHGLFGSSDGNISRTEIPVFESATDHAAKIRFPRIQSNTRAGEQTDTSRMLKKKNSEDASFRSALDFGVLELVTSIIHFSIAVQADIFVGVEGSTYSTDVFSVRYYQHKRAGGGENYVVGPQGIRPLFGPPRPHNC